MKHEKQQRSQQIEIALYDVARKAVKDVGYMCYAVKEISEGEPERMIRLEVYGWGLAMEDRIAQIKGVLPTDFKVERGDQENIYITLYDAD